MKIDNFEKAKDVSTPDLPMVDWLPGVTKERRIPDGRDFSPRGIPAQFIVVHTTGAGVVQKALDAGHKATEDIAKYTCSYYARSGNNVSTHFLIDWDGSVWQILPLSVQGWHAGWSGAARKVYASKEWRKWSHPLGGALSKRTPSGDYAAWRELFPELDSPKALLPKGADSPNTGSVSIDLLAVAGGGPWTTEQIATLDTLTRDLCLRMKIERTSRTVIPHSHLDPIRRMTIKRGNAIVESAWDPKDWPTLASFLAKK